MTIEPSDGAAASPERPADRVGGLATKAAWAGLRRGIVGSVLTGYSEVFFLRSPLIGGAILAATFLKPGAALCGLGAVFSGHVFGRFLKIDRDSLLAGFYTYNPLLSGLAFGSMFDVTFASLPMVGGIGVLAFALTMALNNVFATAPRLPVLSLPFAGLSVLVSLASARFSALGAAAVHSASPLGWQGHLPDWAIGFLRALGGILFLPDAGVGLALGAILLLASRILLALAIAGYAVGTLAVGALTGSLDGAMRDPALFNFMLVAMALGGIYLVPSRSAYALAMTAVLISTLFVEGLEAFWAHFDVPVFTQPFNLTVLLFLYVLGLVAFPRLVRYGKSTPEETLDHALFSRHRYAETATVLMPPFAGRWTVWQGFDGRWTHRGVWRYAYDFVIHDADGRTHDGDGASAADYFAYRKPVLSPLRGRVVRVVRDLPDNPPGVVDSKDRWGNLVLVQGLSGAVVCLSHFAQDSIAVGEGDWVEQGDKLGLCGNSGYSPQPHIHLQVQGAPVIGGSTLPFSLSGYLCRGLHIGEGQPKEHDEIEPCFPDKDMETIVAFVLDESYCFDVLKNGELVDYIELAVHAAVDGTHFFKSGRGILYFGIRNGTFYFFGIEGDDPYLKMLFLALPRLPLTVKEGVAWRDHVPLRAMLSGALREPLLLLASIVPTVATIDVELKRKNRRWIAGTAVHPLFGMKRRLSVHFGAGRGFESIEVDDWELRRAEARLPKQQSQKPMKGIQL